MSDGLAGGRFFDGFRITHVQGCLLAPGKVRVIAEASREIRELIPYVNALVPNAMYGQAGPTLTFKRDWRVLTLYPQLVLIAKANDAQDALGVLSWLTDLINEAHQREGEIAPRFDSRNPPGPLEIYPLLPRTNCKQCGEATCIAFACELLQGGRSLEGCPALAAEARRRLSGMLGLAATLDF